MIYYIYILYIYTDILYDYTPKKNMENIYKSYK